MENKSRLKHTWEQVSHGVGAYASVLIAVIVLGIAFSFASPYFFTGANLKNIGVYMSASGIIAAGVTVSMLLGGLDLSQMSIMAFAGVMVGVAHQAGISGVGLLLVAVLCGVIGGTINAFVMNVLGIDPILTTIGTQLIFRALAYMISKGQYYSISDPLITWIGRGKLFGISTMIWITLIVYIVVGVMLKYTQFGRNVITIGGSPPLARGWRPSCLWRRPIPVRQTQARETTWTVSRQWSSADCPCPAARVLSSAPPLVCSSSPCWPMA